MEPLGKRNTSESGGGVERAEVAGEEEEAVEEGEEVEVLDALSAMARARADAIVFLEEENDSSVLRRRVVFAVKTGSLCIG